MILLGEGLASGQGGGDDKAKAGAQKFESRGSVPVEVRGLIAEERYPGTDAAGGVVEDTVLTAAHALRRAIPEALGALVDEACGKLGAEGADPVKRHHDAAAAVVAELALEVQLAREETRRAPGAAVELELCSPALIGVHHEGTRLEITGLARRKCRLHPGEQNAVMEESFVTAFLLPEMRELITRHSQHLPEVREFIFEPRLTAAVSRRRSK
jgi:hypothetical protein